jgi:Uncharacterized protein conserved in bacteria (DUF2325)
MQTGMECKPIDTRPVTASHAGRRRLWQIDRTYHSSLIGTCLSLQERKELCQKLKIPVQNPAKDAIQRSLVGVASEPSPVARRLHKHLDRKYWHTILRFSEAHSSFALERLWQSAAARGESVGAYWALATHPHASDELLARVRDDAHNPSHVTGSAIRSDRMAPTRLPQSNAAFTKLSVAVESMPGTRIAIREFAFSRRHGRQAPAQTAAGKPDLVQGQPASLESESLALRLRKQVEDYAAMLASERLRAERAEASASEWKQLALRHGNWHQQLSGQLADLKAEREALETMLERMLLEDCGTCRERDECPAGINLCGCCILFVGGGTRQCAHFHALVERQNGRFVHYDGKLNGERPPLGTLLPQADAVFCSLDSVSHDAADRVRQFCSRHKKRLVMLPSASLAAFTRGLNELTA